MKLQKAALLTSVVSFFLLSSFALAHSEGRLTTITGNQIVVDGQTISAGVTPDNPLYGIDLALDRIRLLLTFEQKSKARVGLEVARERLLEAREMIIQNKIEAARTAQNEQISSLSEVESSIAALRRDNSTEEIEDVIEIEREIEEHEDEIETVEDELQVKIRIRGNVTVEQQALIDSILSQMQNKTGEVKIRIDNKKGETKIKIKVETGKDDDEIEELEKRIEVREGLFDLRSEKALEQIEDAEKKINEVKDKLTRVNASQVNVTAVNNLILQAEDHLKKAETAFNETKFGEAFGQANSAERLARNAKRILERLAEEEEDELEIEAEIEEGVTKVKVEINDEESKFFLKTTNRDEIISEIVARFGLSREEVEKVLKIEVEESKSRVVERLRKEVREIRKSIEEDNEEREEKKETVREQSKTIVEQKISSSTEVKKSG